MNWLNLLKRTALVTLVLAALLIGANIGISKWAWFLFLLGHVACIIVFFLMKEKEMLYLNIVFALLDLYGIYRWIL